MYPRIQFWNSSCMLKNCLAQNDKHTKKEKVFKNFKFLDLNPTSVKITLNVNELSTPIKRQRLSNSMQKRYSNISCL